MVIQFDPFSGFNKTVCHEINAFFRCQETPFSSASVKLVGRSFTVEFSPNVLCKSTL